MRISLKNQILTLFVITPLLISSQSEVAKAETESLSVNVKAKEAAKRITVAASKKDADDAPGSVSVVDGEALENQTFGSDDINRILRQVPGVNIQEEEGYGLRPNIGFRGVPNERSSKITLMEDGVLIAPAPYSAPSAYYFPPVGRMQGLEVSKGPGQIKYGPYTTGGALNMLSTQIPEDEAVKLKMGVGNTNLSKAHVYGGKSWKYGGVLLETYQLETDGFKKIDGGGKASVDVEDYQLKGRVNTDPDRPFYQEVEFAFGSYDQISNESYLGLTDEDFGKYSKRRYAASQRDNIDVDHTQQRVRHRIELSDKLDLTTTLYNNDTSRNWYKLGSVGGNSVSSILDTPEMFSEELSWIRGEAGSPDGALKVGANQRDYTSQGVQTVVGGDFNLLETKHSFELGGRFHSDEEDRFQHDDLYTMINGTMVLSKSGAPGTGSNRIGSANAWAFYAQDKIGIDKFTITPGLRYERINYTREDFGKNDPMRTGNSLKRNDTDISSLIPGISTQYDINEELAVFAGVHKGFSPPGPTASNGAKEEESVNYETGAQYNDRSFNSKAVFFFSGYDNLLGADTLSSGGTGSGDLFNGGAVDVYGLEFNMGYDLGEALETSVGFPVQVTYTYTDAEFKSSFEGDFFGDVKSGDAVPYIPKNQFSASVGMELESFGLYFEGFFNDSMVTAAGDIGSSSRTDSYMVFDILARYKYNENVRLFATIENLFDREYVVARRPAGARPGLPLLGVAGFEIIF